MGLPSRQGPDINAGHRGSVLRGSAPVAPHLAVSRSRCYCNRQDYIGAPPRIYGYGNAERTVLFRISQCRKRNASASKPLVVAFDPLASSRRLAEERSRFRASVAKGLAAVLSCWAGASNLPRVHAPTSWEWLQTLRLFDEIRGDSQGSRCVPCQSRVHTKSHWHAGDSCRCIAEG